MSWYYREPTLEEVLSDPIVTALMRADSVDPRELGAMLRRIAEGLRADEGDDDAVLAARVAVAQTPRSDARDCCCL